MDEKYFNRIRKNEKKKREEYIKKNRVGFYVKDTQTEFIASKRYLINDNWILQYDDITGIACANIMRGDDDSFFLIFIRDKEQPIYFNLTYDTEEMQKFDVFMGKLENEIGFTPIWKNDKIILAYPEILRGEELYKKWSYSIKTIIHEILRIFYIKNHASGLIKNKYKQILKTKK